mgnify:CR=1 FL=1
MSAVDIGEWSAEWDIVCSFFITILSILSIHSGVGDQEEWDALLSCEFVCVCKWLGGCIYE